MDDRDIPIRVSVGNISSTVIGSIARSPDLRRALAEFFRAFADEIEGGPDGGTDRTEQPRGSGPAAVE